MPRAIRYANASRAARKRMPGSVGSVGYHWTRARYSSEGLRRDERQHAMPARGRCAGAGVVFELVPVGPVADDAIEKFAPLL